MVNTDFDLWDFLLIDRLGWHHTVELLHEAEVRPVVAQ
jgi:hypothetical protein